MPGEPRLQLSLARKDTTQPSRGTTTTAGAGRGLPIELVEKAVDRLGWVGLIYAIMHVIIHVLNRTVHHDDPQVVQHLGVYNGCLIAGIVLGLGVFFLAHSKKLPPLLMLDIGLLFEVVAGLIISIAETAIPYPPDYLIRGHSALAIWVVFFALIVPTSLGKASLAAFSTAAMGPIGMAFNILAAGVNTPQPSQWMMLYTTPFLMAFWSVLLSRYVYSLGTQVGRAKELGSYDLVELIGTGGMGEVWRARHRMLVHHAAIKLIRPEALCCDSEEEIHAARRRFEREAQATAALHSPHTVALHDYGIAETGAFYYVMELLEGLDIETFVDRFGPQPADRVVYLLRQICDSLAEAHASGLIHRDIKPKNIFVCRLGFNYDFIKVLDFGLVKVGGSSDQSRLTREGITTGTPAFMSPEMAMGHHDVDARTDIYAVGCVAYWMLTGSLVFDATTPLAMALEHVQGKVIPPSQRTEIDVPADVEQIVLQCLEKDPANRPQSARVLARMLDACDAGHNWNADRAEQWWMLHMPATTPTVEIPASTGGKPMVKERAV